MRLTELRNYSDRTVTLVLENDPDPLQADVDYPIDMDLDCSTLLDEEDDGTLAMLAEQALSLVRGAIPDHTFNRDDPVGAATDLASLPPRSAVANGSARHGERSSQRAGKNGAVPSDSASGAHAGAELQPGPVLPHSSGGPNQGLEPAAGLSPAREAPQEASGSEAHNNGAVRGPDMHADVGESPCQSTSSSSSSSSSREGSSGHDTDISLDRHARNGASSSEPSRSFEFFDSHSPRDAFRNGDFPVEHANGSAERPGGHAVNGNGAARPAHERLQHTQSTSGDSAAHSDGGTGCDTDGSGDDSSHNGASQGTEEGRGPVVRGPEQHPLHWFPTAIELPAKAPDGENGATSEKVDVVESEAIPQDVAAVGEDLAEQKVDGAEENAALGAKGDSRVLWDSDDEMDVSAMSAFSRANKYAHNSRTLPDYAARRSKKRRPITPRRSSRRDAHMRHRIFRRDASDLTSYSEATLRRMCRDIGLRDYQALSKTELIVMLTAEIVLPKKSEASWGKLSYRDIQLRPQECPVDISRGMGERPWVREVNRTYAPEGDNEARTVYMFENSAGVEGCAIVVRPSEAEEESAAARGGHLAANGSDTRAGVANATSATRHNGASPLTVDLGDSESDDEDIEADFNTFAALSMEELHAICADLGVERHHEMAKSEMISALLSVLYVT